MNPLTEVTRHGFEQLRVTFCYLIDINGPEGKRKPCAVTLLKAESRSIIWTSSVVTDRSSPNGMVCSNAIFIAKMQYSYYDQSSNCPWQWVPHKYLENKDLATEKNGAFRHCLLYIHITKMISSYPDGMKQKVALLQVCQNLQVSESRRWVIFGCIKYCIVYDVLNSGSFRFASQLVCVISLPSLPTTSGNAPLDMSMASSVNCFANVSASPLFHNVINSCCFLLMMSSASSYRTHNIVC